MQKIIVTGAAGLVGQNLVACAKMRSDFEIVGIDKHPANVDLFRRIHPNVKIIEADLSRPGDWVSSFKGADAVVINQAQIGGLSEYEFEANNVHATNHVLNAMKSFNVPYFVGISSSVVNSAADDNYTRTKTMQENMFFESNIPHVVLRPTLMFGWFDRKHLGWLRRFMDRSPIFPIPGHGNYIRQPLYAGDFISIIIACLERHIEGLYDISGLEGITYKDLVHTIHDIIKPRSRLVNIPYWLFWFLLWFYSWFDRNPPFTTHQLEALVLPEVFPVIDWPGIFNVESTQLRRALAETYLDSDYSDILLEL